MQVKEKEETELPRNTETRELFLYASTDDLPKEGLLTSTDAETKDGQSKDSVRADE